MPIIGGPALGSDGTIYVLVTVGDWTQGFPSTAVALAADGSVRWTRRLEQVAGSTGIVVTPGNERLWIVGKRLYLLTTSGEVHWDSLTATEIPDFKGGAASGSHLVANQGKQLAAYRAADHAWVWETPFARLTDWLVPPTITREGHILAKRTEDTLFVFDGSDGRILRFFSDPDTAVDKRAFGRGTVPVGARYYLPTVKRLAAYDTTGALLWLTEDTGLGVTEPAVAPDGTLFLQHRRYGLEAKSPDGTTKWYRRTVHPLGWGWNEQPLYSWYGGAALAQGGIAYAAGQGWFYAYDAGGTLRWQHVADSAGVPQPFLAAPRVAPDGTVYTWTSTHVYAFWASAPPSPPPRGPCGGTTRNARGGRAERPR